MGNDLRNNAILSVNNITARNLAFEYRTTINCIVTDIGIKESQKAANNDGWYIYPDGFAVSDQKGEFSASRTDMKIPWYQGSISAKNDIDEHTIEFICDIPQNAYPAANKISEVYLLAHDEDQNAFMLCLGQITNMANESVSLDYDPNIAINLRIIINLLNIETLSVFKIVDTCARDIEEHNLDPNAHPDLRKMLETQAGKMVVTSQESTMAQTGDVICANTLNNSLTINLPNSPKDGDKVTVIDTQQMSQINPIVVKPNRGQYIDRCNVNFILNSPGAWVVFLWNERSQSWVIDLGGRNNTGASSSSRTTDIYYSSYFNSGLKLFSTDTDYKLGDIVLGSDFNLYMATSTTGPASKNAQDPTFESSILWTPFSNKKVVREVQEAVKKGTAFIVPSYTKGSGQLNVYIQGIKCLEGLNPMNHTFYEDNSIKTGKRANKIYFYDDIPANFGLVIIRE